MMKGLITSRWVIEHIAKHSVTRREVEQCFENRCGNFLYDNRENNKTDPPTEWFVAETNSGRRLKIVFVPKDGKIFLKTAYDANPEEVRIYEKYGN